MPIILNTSFNDREPIVETPEDAAPDVVEKAPTDVVKEVPEGPDPGWMGDMEGEQNAALRTEAEEVVGDQAGEQAERVLTTIAEDVGKDAATKVP